MTHPSPPVVDDGRQPLGEGVPASPSGYSAEPEPGCTVSAVPVSIPNAKELAALLRREGRYSGVWFARKLIEAADMIDPPIAPVAVEEDGWSEWLHPTPPSFLSQCCDCGLVHEMEFQIVRRAKENSALNSGETEDAVIIFRARRAEAPQ